MASDATRLQRVPSIPHIGSVVARRAIGGREPAGAEMALHLNELVPLVRQRLGLDTAFPDDAVLASLRTIAGCSTPRERWRAAFDSNLGHWLALQGADLNSALNTLVALLPAPRM